MQRRHRYGQQTKKEATAAEYQASYGVFKAAFDVPLGPFDASRWTRASAAGEDAGEDEDGDAGEDEDEDEVVGTGAAAVPTLEWAAGCAAWYVGHALAALPAPFEATRPQGGEGGHGMDDAVGDDAAARRGDGSAGGGGAERVGEVGMEVEGPTDGAVAVGRGAAGMAAAGSTDMGAASEGAIGMEAGGAGTEATVGTGGKKKKKRKDKKRKKGGSTQVGRDERRRRP